MPYINKKDRTYYRIPIEILKSLNNPGQLNYIFTQCIAAYLENKGLKYQTLAEITGSLVDAKDEFKRRIVAPYEDIKIKENGDVYS
jgi:hypothetical protein